MQTTEASEAVALKEKISHDAERMTAEIRAEIGELETQYLKARKEQKWGLFLIIGSFLLPSFALEILNQAFFILPVIILMFFSLIKGLRLFFGNFSLIKQYHTAVNQVIFGKVFTLLGVQGRILKDEPIKLDSIPLETQNNKRWQAFQKLMLANNSVGTFTALAELKKSELITEEHNTNQVDNILEINYKDSVIRIAELDIKHTTGSGKNRSTKHIFRGYLVSFDLKRELTGKTFVSAEGDKQGFGNLAFFESAEGDVRETMLEWNEFENLLHVATNDGVEARYILTPDFMHDLYNWWRGRKTNIRLSFIGNRLYILYPDKEIRLNQTVEKITDEAVSDYIYTIIWPIQNVIKLIDDVRL